MTALLTSIIEILVGGIVQLAEGIGAGLTALVTEIFVNEIVGEGGAVTYELTAFGGLIVVFAGIALAIGLSRFVMNLVTSFGN